MKEVFQIIGPANAKFVFHASPDEEGFFTGIDISRRVPGDKFLILKELQSRRGPGNYGIMLYSCKIL